MKTNKYVPLLIPIIAMLSACGGGLREPKVTDPEFEGLDHEAVEELLVLPFFVDNENPQNYETQEAYNREAASYVYVMQVCRDYYDAYVEWTQTGQQPATPQRPPVSQSGEGFRLEEWGRPALESGDPYQLLEFLAGPESCGGWVPVSPGSPKTIEETLKLDQ